MNNPLDYSQEYAALYDIITRHKNYETEAELLHAILLKCMTNSNNPQVLSIGCGTGNHELLLARKGFEVTGIDTSTAMINEAKNKKHDLLRFEHVSLEEYSNHNKQTADGVVCLFNVINCLQDISSLMKFFESAFAVMRVGSILFLECWNAVPCIITPPETVKRSFTCPNGTFAIDRIATPSLNLVDQKLSIRYLITGTYQRKPIHVESLHNITLFTPMEIRFALEQAGFSGIEFSSSLSAADEACTFDESRMNAVLAYR